MKTDIQIAQEATLKPITEIAAGLGLGEDDISLYGKYKAKIDHRLAKKAQKQGKRRQRCLPECGGMGVPAQSIRQRGAASDGKHQKYIKQQG